MFVLIGGRILLQRFLISLFMIGAIPHQDNGGRFIGLASRTQEYRSRALAPRLLL